MVVDPVAIPPLLRVDLHTVKLHAEMHVVTTRHSCRAALAHALATFDHIAFVHVDLAEMTVDGLQAVTVVHDNAVAINAERRRVDDLAIVGSNNVGMLRAGKVVTQMDLLIDLLPVVDVIPHVSEVGLHLCVGLLQERLRP